jgi:hypothetical protein
MNSLAVAVMTRSKVIDTIGIYHATRLSVNSMVPSQLLR